MFLGATASVGDIQRLREHAKQKQATTFTINGRSVALNAFYNALQAHGGALDVVRLAVRPGDGASPCHDRCCMCCNSLRISGQPIFCCVQTFKAPHGASDPLRNVAKLLGIDCKKTSWRRRLTSLWHKELKQFVQHLDDACLQEATVHAC